MGCSITLHPFFTSGYLVFGRYSGSAGEGFGIVISALVTITPKPWIIQPAKSDNIDPNNPTIHAIVKVEYSYELMFVTHITQLATIPIIEMIFPEILILFPMLLMTNHLCFYFWSFDISQFPT